MANNFHESYQHQAAADGPSDRSFGFVMGTALAIFGLLPLIKHNPVRWWLLAPAGVLFLLAIASPGVLKPLNKAWMKLALLIAKVTNPIITGLMFFLIFTPAGLLLRAMGKDMLRLRFDKTAESYWIRRDPPGPAPDSMQNQF